MNAEQLYKMKPIGISDTTRYLINNRGVDHIPEARVSEQIGRLCYFQIPHVSTRVLKQDFIGSDKLWMLATVWYKSNPVMVITNYGVAGSEYSRRFVTDSSLLTSMCAYIASESVIAMAKYDSLDNVDIISKDVQLRELTHFCGLSI